MGIWTDFPKFHINKCSYKLIFYEKNEPIPREYKYLEYYFA